MMLADDTPSSWRHVDLIIWYAAYVHLLWAYALLTGDGTVNIPALRSVSALGAHALGWVCLGAALQALFASARRPSWMWLLLLLPQQGLLILAGNEAFMAAWLAYQHPEVVQPAGSSFALQGRNVGLAMLHTWAVLRVFVFQRRGK